jgi:hypothetical protein
VDILLGPKNEKVLRWEQAINCARAMISNPRSSLLLNSNKPPLLYSMSSIPLFLSLDSIN